MYEIVGEIYPHKLHYYWNELAMLLDEIEIHWNCTRIQLERRVAVANALFSSNKRILGATWNVFVVDSIRDEWNLIFRLVGCVVCRQIKDYGPYTIMIIETNYKIKTNTNIHKYDEEYIYNNNKNDNKKSIYNYV